MYKARKSTPEVYVSPDYVDGPDGFWVQCYGALALAEHLNSLSADVKAAWISVDDRLPERQQKDYPVFCGKNGWIEIGTWIRDEGGEWDWFYTEGYPTHWIELPAVPVHECLVK